MAAHWRREGRGVVDLDATPSLSLFYNLVEFPYPSAEGLHVGHVFRYSGVDTYGRYRRMRGQAGVPADRVRRFRDPHRELRAQVGEHPRDADRRTTARFARQLSTLGMAWDWTPGDRHEPTRATTAGRSGCSSRLFGAGLMYQAEAPVVWCPSCLTVLAREQTEDDGTVASAAGRR